MDVKIIETGEIVELSIRDVDTNIDWTEEIVGNNGGFGPAKDGLIERTENEPYEATAETVKWWQDYISGYEATKDEIRNLAEELDIDRADIRDYVGREVDIYDMDAYRALAIKALQALREDPSLIRS